jgi:hypothetical protein
MAPTPITFSDTTPAAPGTDINVKFQTDASGNLSAHVPTGGSGAPGGALHCISVTNSGLGNTGSLGCSPTSVGEGGPFTVTPPLWYRLQGVAATAAILDSGFVLTPAILQQMQFYVGISNGAFTSSLTGLRWWLCASNLGYGSMNATHPAGNIIGFRFDASVDTNWQAYVSTDAVTYTVVDTGVAPNPVLASPGAVTDQFKFAADGSGGWNFYIDGTLVANIPTGSTGMPAGTTTMTYMMECDAQATYESQLYVHSMQWWSKY